MTSKQQREPTRFDAIRTAYSRWLRNPENPRPPRGGKPSNALIEFFASPEGQAELARFREARQ
jgi:hypothetical protein